MAKVEKPPLKLCGFELTKENVFGGFQTPVSIELKDWKLGLLHKSLQLLACLYPIYMFWTFETSYRVTELPVAIPTFWFETSGTDLAGNDLSIAQVCQRTDTGMPGHPGSARAHRHGRARSSQIGALAHLTSLLRPARRMASRGASSAGLWRQRRERADLLQQL